jgi:glycosyltransferase involved in cell wall biosynthesis
MRERGYRVIIAAPPTARIYERAGQAGITVFPARFRKKNPVSLIEIFSLITREGVGIVNTHSSADSWVSTLAARLSRPKPKIIRTRHLSTPISKSYLSRLIYDLFPDAIMTTGEEIRRRMIYDNRFGGEKIVSIPTGIDLDLFDPARVRPAFQSDGYSIGIVGVLRSWKGHQYFIEAIPEICERIPDAHFYIAGEGPQQENIKKLISRLSVADRVFMLGHREDIPEVLSSLDVVVQPSYAHEGVPQSVLQAMAMEKPVVAADTGAIKEVVKDGQTGFLIKPRDVHEIAEKVTVLYHNPDLGASLGREGRRLVKGQYSLDVMLDKIEKLYKGLLQKGG